MYHSRLRSQIIRLAFYAGVSVSFLCSPLAGALETVNANSELEGINYHKGSASATTFEVLPPERLSKSKPQSATLYQYDETPLGDRNVVLLVHGLRGEYYPYFRWGKVAKRFNNDKAFAKSFKLYLVRYDSTANFSQTVPQMREQLSKLYEATNKKPIRVLALSMGGNLTFEAMQDKQTDEKVSLLMTLATPFHGSPLFTANWLQYGIYKNPSLPWTRIDHAVAYRLYFARNPNLLADLRWDNSDGAIPDVGHFKSHLPLGPSGNLTIADSINRRILEMDQHTVDKKKIVAYSGYLSNPYMLPDAERFIETACLYPYTFVTVKLAAHLAREHAVLKLLNHIIASVQSSPEATARANWRFLYDLNDGITPLSSALFLPNAVCDTQYLVKESDLAKVRSSIDVGQARVFRNVDHLSFIDAYRPLKITSPNLKDQLNPADGSRDIFGWMLTDITRSVDENKTLAKGTPVESVARQ
jgi:pimeloyl-ACP methyl ester carboxylesterase